MKVINYISEAFEELKSNYYKSLKELYRISDDNGIVVMKCQDQVSGGKNYFTHSMVMSMVNQIGFYTKDLFILTLFICIIILLYYLYIKSTKKDIQN